VEVLSHHRNPVLLISLLLEGYWGMSPLYWIPNISPDRAEGKNNESGIVDLNIEEGCMIKYYIIIRTLWDSFSCIVIGWDIMQ
jgi:hypothetical protein